MVEVILGRDFSSGVSGGGGEFTLEECSGWGERNIWLCILWSYSLLATTSSVKPTILATTSRVSSSAPLVHPALPCMSSRIYLAYYF